MTINKGAQMTATQIIALAQKHIGQGSMASSARVCLNDAIALLAAKNEEGAKKRARDSLLYSVGAFHLDYRNAN